MTPVVLIVEDTPANMKLASLLVSRAGCEVLQAENGMDGIALACEKMPDLILMDIQMPGMDGLEATRVLKANPATRAIPIIALTAFAMKGDEERMIEAGCNGYIAKPIQYQQFLDKIKKILGLSA